MRSRSRTRPSGTAPAGASIRADNAPSGGTGPSARTGQTAGEVFVQLASMLAAGEEPKDGMELAGVGPVQVFPDKKLIQAQKLEALDKANIDRLVELGL